VTIPLDGSRLAQSINQNIPGAAVEWDETNVWIKPDSWLEAAQFLKKSPDLDFAYLNAVTGVDYIEHFEVVYHLTSIRHNHSAVIKVRTYDRDDPKVQTVTPIWQGADLQEREVWDLMGVKFENHRNMKRILLWEDFPGHPLRKDFLR